MKRAMAVGELTMADLADSIFAFGKARYNDTQTLRAASAYTLTNISKATGTDFSKLLSGLAWLRYQDFALIAAIAKHIVYNAVEVDKPSIAEICGALARLGYTS